MSGGEGADEVCDVIEISNSECSHRGMVVEDIDMLGDSRKTWYKYTSQAGIIRPRYGRAKEQAI